MIFLTVGTQFSFDRLVKAVDKACAEDLVDEEIFAQTGKSSYKPRNFESVNFMDNSHFDSCIRRASSVVGHAGMGTITMALENHKPLLVMPRQKKYGEVVNDHQVVLARRFEELNHFLVAYEAEDLPHKLKQIKTFVPRKRKVQPQLLVERITQFLTKISTDS